MLGMMNCPTEQNFDFYAASPSAMRQLNGTSVSASAGNSPKMVHEGVQPLGREKRSSSNALEAFTAVHQRPKISYTENGRRLINGKLETADSSDKLWGRLIVDSSLTSKMCGQQSGSTSSNNSMELEQQQEQAKIETKEGKNSKDQNNKKRRFSLGALLPMFVRSRKASTPVEQNEPQEEQKMTSVAAAAVSSSAEAKKCSTSASIASTGAQSI